MVLQRVPSNVPALASGGPSSSRIAQKLPTGLSVAAIARRRRLKSALVGEAKSSEASSSTNRTGPSSVIKTEVDDSNDTSFDTLQPEVPSGSTGATGATTFSKAQKQVVFNLRKHMARPAMCDINLSIIAAIEPELAETPIQYIRDILQEAGPSMWNVLKHTSYAVPKVLPKDLKITVSDFSADMPTHMLVVYRDASSNTEGPGMIFTPVHAIILGAYCAHIHALPSSKPLPPDPPNDKITIPIAAFRIPAPAIFLKLLEYLYDKNAEKLMKFLLPITPDIAQANRSTFNEALKIVVRRLANEYELHLLARHALTLNALWRNVCALGISDEKLWITMGISWRILYAAIAIHKAKSAASSSSSRS